MRKLNLKELELKLPKIDENYSKILLGGNTYADDAVFGGGCDLIKDKEIADIGWNGPLEHDNSLDLDVSIDGYEYNDGYQDEGQNGGNNTGVGSATVINFTPPASLLDGMNLNVNTLYIGTPAGQFTNQLEFILQSNSHIANLLAPVNNGQLGLIFNTDNLNSNTLAETNIYGYPSMDISFNASYITSEGWVAQPGGTTDGFDLSMITGAQGITEQMRQVLYLAHVIAHESFHANAWNVFMSHLAANGADPNNPLYSPTTTNQMLVDTVQELLTAGYSPEFVNIFGHVQPDVYGNEQFVLHLGLPAPFNPYGDTDYSHSLSHDYMVNNEQGVFDDIIEEALNDLLELQNIKNNMETWLQELQNNAQQYGDESNGDGGTPSGPNWPDLYQEQLEQYNQFMEQYGHLFD